MKNKIVGLIIFSLLITGAFFKSAAAIILTEVGVIWLTLSPTSSLRL